VESWLSPLIEEVKNRQVFAIYIGFSFSLSLQELWGVFQTLCSALSDLSLLGRAPGRRLAFAFL
jgi:hypothetical protein